jgi:hypothetical protein
MVTRDASARSRRQDAARDAWQAFGLATGSVALGLFAVVSDKFDHEVGKWGLLLMIFVGFPIEVLALRLGRRASANRDASISIRMIARIASLLAILVFAATAMSWLAILGLFGASINQWLFFWLAIGTWIVSSVLVRRPFRRESNVWERRSLP